MTSSKPRVRALLVDARVGGRSVVDALVARRIAKGRHRISGCAIVETEKLEVLFEELHASMSLDQRLARMRGVDVAVLLAGNATGVAGPDMRALFVCGVRTAITLVEPGGPSDLEENLGRHLLLGADLAADDMPALALRAEAAELVDDDVSALFDALDTHAIPRAVDDGFLLGGVAARGTDTVTTRVLRGALDEVRGQGSLFVDGDDFVDVTFGCSRGRAGDPVVVELDHVTTVPDEFLLSDRPLDLVSHFRVDLDPPLYESEHVVVFGGAHGFTSGHVHDGVIACGALALVDDVVGLVRTRGYAQVLSTRLTRV